MSLRDHVSDTTDFEIVVSSHVDVESARRHYQELRAACSELAASELDMVILGRSDKGEMRILRRHEFTATFGTSVGPGWGIAAGLALALFPASTEGTGFRSRAAGEEAVLATTAEVVRSAVGWDQMRQAGAQVEAHPATVVCSVPRSRCGPLPPGDPEAVTSWFRVGIDLPATEALIASTYREATT